MSSHLTADQIRQRLACTNMPVDPLAVDFMHMGARMPESIVQRVKPQLRAAGVLIPVVDHPESPSLLFTERSSTLRHHAGQVSFPGGSMETEDENILATALREAREEVGIKRDEVEVVGYLEPVATITGFAVTCVIGIVPPTINLTPDRLEVDEIFEVPFSYLVDKGNMEIGERIYEGKCVPVATYYHEGHRIWGVTASMIVGLLKVLNN